MIDALAVTTDEARQGIDARQLHAALGIGRDFATWVADCIARFELQEGRDYSRFDSPERGNQAGRGGDRRSVEYALSLPTAKLIAISTRGPEAIRAREALIKIEEAWNSPTAVMARAVILAHAENQRLRAEHAALLPKAQAADRLLEAGGDLSIREAAKALGVSERQFVADLLRWRVVYRDARGRLAPYAEHVTAGRLRVRVVVIGEEEGGDDRVTVQTMVRPAGLLWLQRRYSVTAAPAALETRH